jgi:hypothetical protein
MKGVARLRRLCIPHASLAIDGDGQQVSASYAHVRHLQIENHHDDHGLVWPKEAAPYAALIVPLGAQKVRGFDLVLFTQIACSELEVRACSAKRKLWDTKPSIMLQDDSHEEFLFRGERLYDRLVDSAPWLAKELVLDDRYMRTT